MAYGNYIAAVNLSDVIKLRKNLQQKLKPIKVSFVTQLTSFWVKEQPLGEYLAKILNGGEDLSRLYWHPFQVPKVYLPDTIHSLETNLQKAWNELDSVVRETHPFQCDIAEIMNILKTAVENNGAFLSVLEPPADKERAERVICPFDESYELPVQWNNLSLFFRNLS